jgi:hypothetical protein
MKRKRKQQMLTNLTNRQRTLYSRSLFADRNDKITYIYKNTMGGYQIALGNHPLNDFAVAIRYNINPNEYRKIVEKFRAIEYRGVSYFNSIEDIENLLVLLSLSR